MSNIVVTFQADPNPAVTGYNLFFTTTPSGSATPNAPLTLSVPRSSVGDASGYIANYTDMPSAPALNPGDSVACTIESAAGSIFSPVITDQGSPIVVPTPPPPPVILTGPINVVATYQS